MFENTLKTKYFLFTDPHPLGGQSFILITEDEILDEYRLQHSELSRTEQLHEFLVVNSATEITKETYDLLMKTNNHFLLRKT